MIVLAKTFLLIFVFFLSIFVVVLPHRSSQKQIENKNLAQKVNLQEIPLENKVLNYKYSIFDSLDMDWLDRVNDLKQRIKEKKPI